MWARLRRLATLGSCTLAVTLALGSALPVRAAEEDADRDPWAPWLGCWELVVDRDAEGEHVPEGRREVCLAPGSEPLSVELATRVDDDVVMTQVIRADGRARDVEEAGCVGSETARFSADGDRLLVTGTHSCEGVQVHTSGITLLTSSDRWSDIQVSEVEGQREILVRRYRRAVTEAERASALATLAARAARQASSAPLDADDVIEAAATVDEAAVEAMLLEKDDPFPMSSDLLLYLADSGVSGNLIDLMVALSYPDYFLVDDGTGETRERPEPYYGTRYLGGWGYPWYAYGYYDPFFAPFGYGYYYRPVRPILVPGSRFGGRVIKGRGYIRVRPSQNMPRGGFGQLFRSGDGRRVGGGSGDDRGTGSVTKQGATRGKGSSTGRTAKRRGGQQDDGR